MDLKMPKSQEQSEQLQNKELESIAGGQLNDLVKNLSLRGKVAKWAAVTVSVVGIFITMAAMPAGAIHRVTGGMEDCGSSKSNHFFRISQGAKDSFTMCFADRGTATVVIADVHNVYSGNNAGYIITNKGRFNFEKNTGFNFVDNNYGTVTILKIVIY